MSPKKRHPRTKAPRARAPRISLSVLALVLVGVAGCSGLNSQDGNAPLPTDAGVPAPATTDAAVRSSPVVPGRAARVFIFAAFADNCDPLPAPQLTVTAKPAKGDLKFVPDQETTIKTSGKGTCIGQTGKGTGLYYTARAGETGTDRFSVTAKLDSGEIATRNFEVRIAE